MFATVAFLLPAAVVSAAPEMTIPANIVAIAGLRQRPTQGPAKRGIHELKDPTSWPAEPTSPVGALDPDRFDAALIKLCGEVAPDAGLPELARVVRTVSAEVKADPFLIAALVYRESRCRPGLAGASGIGLLQIKPSMFAAGARLPFPREDLSRERLLDPEHNLRTGAALLAMWEAEHDQIDRALGSTPHRTAVAHFFWGDKVWGTTSEDRTFTARRRLLESYANPPVAYQPSSLGLEIVSPLEGAPRLGTSGLGADREEGARAHRGVDVDATIGEPVRAVADGVVVFAGADMTGDHPALALLPRQTRRWRNRTLGPGGLFVRVLHTNGVRSGYFHLNGFRVAEGQTVRAGEIIGTVGRTGIKASGSHLHFEIHVDGELKDPAKFLAAYVLPPEKTITHQLAKAERRQRLARARRMARA
jgi:murein DD-endopeptidase MepM/ murein hydrolase activator NlpD